MALPDILARPIHALELKQVDPSGVVTVDIATEKGAVQAAVQALINAYKAEISGDYPPDYATAEAGIDTLASDIDAAIVAMPNPDASTSSALDAVYAAYDALEIAEGRDKFCPQCSSTGLSTDAQGNQILCPLSDGYNHTVEQYYADPVSIVYTQDIP